MTKRLLSGILAVIMCLSFIPVFNIQTMAADEYNYKNALKYAKKHWNDGKGLCAEFVSDCLKAGGITGAYDTMAVNLYNELVQKNIGKSYKLKLTGGTRGYVMKKDNESKLQAGDPIFFKCNACKRITHVVICNGYNSDGYSVYYAHNKAHNGKSKTVTYPHCGTTSWTMYSVRMNDGGLIYGAKSKVATPKINYSSLSMDGINVKWNKVKNVDYYRLYRMVPGGKWEKVVDVKDAFYKDTSVKNGQEYLYTVRAVKDKVKSQYYGGYSVKFIAGVNFIGAESDGKYIKIAWQRNSKADGYIIYRKEGHGKFKRYKDIDSNKTTSFTDKKVKSTKEYQYRILCYENTIKSSYNPDGIKAVILKAPKLTSIKNRYTGVTLTWNSVKNAAAYKVYRRYSTKDKWKCIATVKDLSYTDTGAQSGKKVQYTVRSVSKYKNKCGYDKNGLVVLYLKSPVLDVMPNKDGMKLQWDLTPGAKGYYVYQKEEDSNQWIRVATLGSKVTEYTATSVELNVNYSFAVRAFNGKIRSYYSPVNCVYNPPVEEVTVPIIPVVTESVFETTEETTQVEITELVQEATVTTES